MKETSGVHRTPVVIKTFAVVFVTANDAMDWGGVTDCRVPEIKSYILSQGHSVFGRKKKKFWRFVSRSHIPKFRK